MRTKLSWVAVLVASLAGPAFAEPSGNVAKGDQAMILGDYAKAKEAYQQAVTASPHDAVAQIRLAFVDEQLGDDPGAIAILREVTAADASHADAWQLLGLALVRTRAFADAAAAFEKYVALVPGDFMTRLELARAYAGAQARDRALAEYAKVIATAGDNAVVKLAQEEIFGVKYGAAGQVFKDGKTAFVSGDYRGAVSKLETVVRQYPELEEAQFLLGMAYDTPDINRRGDAMAAWSKAPTVKEAQLHLAIELHNDGDLKNAETRFRAALAIDGKFQEAWYLLGELYEEKGDSAAAKEAWEHALSLDPSSQTGKWAKTRINVDAGNVDEPFEEGEVIDPATEVLLGRKIVDEIIKQYGLFNDERLQARLDAIWERLTAVTDRGDLRYKLYVFKYDIPNGFTFPGGNVMIPSGMIDTIRLRLGDKDEYYAALLSHELAHATLRHNTETVRFEQAKLHGAGADRAMAELAIRATRQQEYEADKYGALYMYRAGFNPNYMLEFWKLAPRVFGESQKGADHATHEERAAIMREDLIELRGRVQEFERGNEALKNGDYTAAQEHYEVFLAVMPGSAPGRLNYAVALHRQALRRIGSEQKFKRTTDLDPDAKLAKIEVNSTVPGGGADLDPRIDQRLLHQAESAYQMALRIDPDYALARMSYGALLMDLGQTKKAVVALERASKLAPESAGTWNNLGVAYAMAGDAKKAQAALEKATKTDAKLADPWFNLGVVLGDTGKNDQAAVAFDEYAKRDALSGWTKAARERRAELTSKKPKGR